MKTILEYLNEDNKSTIWKIKLKNNDITIVKSGKDITTSKNLISYPNKIIAKNNYDKKILNKLEKGYNDIEEKNIKNKLIEKKLRIQSISPYIYKLLKFSNKISHKQDKYYKIDNDIINNKVIAKYYDKYLLKFVESINKYQNKKINNFLKSGVIVKQIPSTLTQSLLEQIIIFSNNIKVDYHPNSDNKVRDIIHPSIYPLLIKTKKSDKLSDFWSRKYEESEFQWLPSEFDIDNNGKCKINSYINNLPLTYTDLYKQIEKLFEYVLPQLENVWSFSNLIKSESNELKTYGLKNKTIQVITKIVTINLSKESDLIGAWHIEGMPHENIVATASCTLYQDSCFKGSILFKRSYTEQEENYIRGSINQDPIKHIKNIVANQHVPVGKVNLKENRLIVFPNSHVHKVDMFNNGLSNQSRTIIVFWLINPDVRIKSTKHIKQQNYDITIAHKNRIKLMLERTNHKQTFNQRDINLCEH